MVASSGESSLDLQAILGTLESKSASGEQLLEAYTTLSSHLTENELSLFDRDIVQQGKRLLVVTKKHAQGKGGVLDSVAQKALCVMGYCLNDKDIISFLPIEETSELLVLLSELITETKEKSTCSHALWCLGKQSIAHDIISAELPLLLKAIQKAASIWWGVSVIVEHEGLAAISRLCDQCEREMVKSCMEWGPILLRLLASAAPKVRHQAFECATKWEPVFAKCKECLRLGASALKKPTDVQSFLDHEYSEICFSGFIEPELKKMFKNGMESFVLKTCTLLLRIFQQELHHSVVINSLLSLFELAFRCSSQEVRAQAFVAWRVLIDVFMANGSLAEPKHVDLIMRVFMTRNTATEAVAQEKLETWWHYVQCLGPWVWHQFDQILKPLMQFCLGNTRLGTSTPTIANTLPGPLSSCSSPAVTRYALTSSTTYLNLPTFPRVQQCGLEILAHLLRVPGKTPSSSLKFMLDPLKTDVTISAGVFLKNAPVLIAAIFEFTKVPEINASETLLLYVWQCMASHMHSALDTTRSERHAALSLFLEQFQVLILSQILPQEITMKLFHLVCSFPQKVLSSTAFSLRHGEVVKGCPAQFLCEVLLTPGLLKETDRRESFITVFSALVRCGTGHPTGVLEFCQSIGDLLDRNAQFMSSAEILWRLWSIVVHTVQDHITKTNEVNQGDSLGYNFDCLYTILLLPITHQIGTKVNLTIHKTALKTWMDLYCAFARLSALVSNAEANIALEELAHKILTTVTAENFIKDIATLDHLLELCRIMVDTVDFSSLVTANPFMQGMVTSPAKKIRHRPKALGNLHSFISLFAQLGQWITAFLKDERELSVQEEVCLGLACNSIVDTASVLVDHLNVSSLVGHMMEKLASPLAGLFSPAVKTPVKMLSPSFLQKLERLWKEICSLMQHHYKGPYDSDLLSHLAPLLEATFQYPRRQIRTQTTLFWNSTFGHTSVLSYPVNLELVLSKVKKKMQLSLPGWSSLDVAVIDETPISQLSQMESQVPDPVLPGMPSPVRQHGSFRNKDVSPKPSTLSPTKAQSLSENRALDSGIRKRLPVDLMPEKDFVVIKDAPKKRRVLTEHQKEIMKEKRVLPAMYNNLDASLDTSCMSQSFSSDTQQDSMTTHSPVSDVFIVSSSQSQDLLQPIPVDISHHPEGRTQRNALSRPRRSLRLHSVHFDSVGTSEDGSVNSACATNKTQEHDPAMHEDLMKNSETRVTLPHTPSSEASQISEKAEGSLGMPSPQPNVMAAVAEKLVDTLSSRDTTQSSKSASSESSRGETQTKVSAVNDPFFRPFRLLSQSLPRTRSLGSGQLDSSEGSVLFMTRKTRSQEMRLYDNVHSVPEKPGNSFSLFTRLEKWLNKSSRSKKCGDLKNLSDVTDNNLGEKSKFSQEPLKDDLVVVEETQSPSKFAQEKASTNLSVEEISTMTSASTVTEHSQSSRFCMPVIQTESSDTHSDLSINKSTKIIDSLDLKKPILQLERTEGDLMDKLTTVLPALPVSLDTSTSAENEKIILQPQVLCSELSSQGFVPEPKIPLSLIQSPDRNIMEQKSVTQYRMSIDHRTLFGFSELLEEENKSSGSGFLCLEAESKRGENDSDPSVERSGGMLGNQESEGYDPQLEATFRLTPPHHFTSHASETSIVSDSPSSPFKISSNTSQSSQRSSRCESEVTFDPAKESTLFENSEHAKKRKQKTPKKVTDPLLLRRTSRKKKDKKYVCACCRDGSGVHHQAMSPASGNRKQRSKSQGKDSLPVQSTDIPPLPGKASKSLGINNQNVEKGSEEAKLADRLTEESVEKQVEFSPQDIGEKTPEAKTSSTPLRHSTTKRKMEAARRRSVSLTFGNSLNKVNEFDSDSDDLPLSQVAKISKFQCAHVVHDTMKQQMQTCDHEDSAQTKVTDKNSLSSQDVKNNSPCDKITNILMDKTKKCGAYQFRLKKQKVEKYIRSPPKLRLRKRKLDEVQNQGSSRKVHIEPQKRKQIVLSKCVLPGDMTESCLVFTDKQAGNHKSVDISEGVMSDLKLISGEPTLLSIEKIDRSKQLLNSYSLGRRRNSSRRAKSAVTYQGQLHRKWLMHRRMYRFPNPHGIFLRFSRLRRRLYTRLSSGRFANKINIESSVLSVQNKTDTVLNNQVSADSDFCSSSDIFDTTSNVQTVACKSPLEVNIGDKIANRNLPVDSVVHVPNAAVVNNESEVKSDISLTKEMGISEKGPEDTYIYSSGECIMCKAVDIVGKEGNGNLPEWSVVHVSDAAVVNSELEVKSDISLVVHVPNTAVVNNESEVKSNISLTKEMGISEKGPEDTYIYSSGECIMHKAVGIVGNLPKGSVVHVSDAAVVNSELEVKSDISLSIKGSEDAHVSSSGECVTHNIVDIVGKERNGNLPEGSAVHVPDTAVVNSESKVKSDIGLAEKMGIIAKDSDDAFLNSPGECVTKAIESESCIVERERPIELSTDMAETCESNSWLQKQQRDCTSNVGSPGAEKKVSDNNSAVQSDIGDECSEGKVCQSLLNVQDVCEAEEEMEGCVFIEDSSEHLFPDSQVEMKLGKVSPDTSIDFSAGEVETGMSPDTSFDISVDEVKADEPSGLTFEISTSEAKSPEKLEIVGSDLYIFRTLSEDSNVVISEGSSTQTEDQSEKGLSTTSVEQSAAKQDTLNAIEKCHVSLQTSPQQQIRHKLSKKEILELIAESDVSPSEIIAALQPKSSKARRLFATLNDTPLSKQKNLPGRGMKMLQKSIFLQQHQPFQGYSTKSVRTEVDSVSSVVVPSPSASPSGSILKKRDGTVAQDTEESEDPSQSPASSKRRVSFADPIISGESPAHEATLSKMPWYYNKPVSFRKLSVCALPHDWQLALQRQARRRALFSQIAAVDTEAEGNLPSSSKEVSAGSADQLSSESSQNTYSSTQESQLNYAEPIFPALVQCDKPVDLVLPQLTSSLWHRGLCQLMKSRGVNTIGNLAALSEVEVQGMPVRAPKVENVKMVLTNFHSQHYSKKLTSAAEQAGNEHLDHSELRSAGDVSDSASKHETAGNC